jgi:serine/threonine protein kinase
MMAGTKTSKTQKIEFLGAKKHMKRGLEFFQTGEYQRAIDEFELVLLHDRKNVRAYNNLGYVFRKIGAYDRALDLWREGLNINPSYRRLKKNVARLQEFLQSKDENTVPPEIEIDEIGGQPRWLSENSTLVRVCEGRLFETRIVEDRGVTYALKTLRKPLARDQQVLRAFERACSGWLRLPRNENAIRAHALEWVSGRPFLVLDYASEGSLRNLPVCGVGAAGGLTVPQVLDIVLQACMGLHFVHENFGAAHGDVRLENLMLRRSGEGGDSQGDLNALTVKVSDIGLWGTFAQADLFLDTAGDVLFDFAQEGLVQTPSGYLTASLHRCAPELLESIRVPTRASDIYMFGVALYELFTGMLPFSGSNPSELLDRMRVSRPDHPSTINVHVPSAVGTVVMRCLERRPEARCGDFREVAAALVEYLAGARTALAELSQLCGRYRRLSKFQFEDTTTESAVMIVGGTAFSSEIGQVWEILKRQADKSGDASIEAQIARIEKALGIPGLSIGELYPTLESMGRACEGASPEEHCERINTFSHGGRGIVAPGAESDEEPAAEPPDAERPARAPQALAETFTMRADALLLESPEGENLRKAFRDVAVTDAFCATWLPALFEELPTGSICPGAADFLRAEAGMTRDAVAAMCGLTLMMAGKFSPALETFNMISEERYLPALGIYLWALAEFRSEDLETIRVNSLKNARRLAKEGIVITKRRSSASGIGGPSQSRVALANLFFLRALVLEQLEEYRHAVMHLRELKRILDSDPAFSPALRCWADIVQGACMHALGMPSEAFMRWQRVLMRGLEPPFFDFLEMGTRKPRALLARYYLERCERALSLFPENPALWSLKGKLLNCAGREREALGCADKALEINDNFYPACFVKMESLLLERRHEEALDALKICTLRDPHEPSLMLREAEIQCLLGRADRAHSELQRAIEHGIDISELSMSLRNKRLPLLDGFDDVAATIERLGPI